MKVSSAARKTFIKRTVVTVVVVFLITIFIPGLLIWATSTPDLVKWILKVVIFAGTITCVSFTWLRMTTLRERYP